MIINSNKFTTVQRSYIVATFVEAFISKNINYTFFIFYFEEYFVIKVAI
jgi:hypothetical protein